MADYLRPNKVLDKLHCGDVDRYDCTCGVRFLVGCSGTRLGESVTPSGVKQIGQTQVSVPKRFAFNCGGIIWGVGDADFGLKSAKCW
jgi:hypothetical protein